MSIPPNPAKKAPETLAERFWSIAREMEGISPTVEVEGQAPDPVAIVRHVLRVLDALDEGAQGQGVTVNTLSFLVLLRQHELRGDLLYASPEQARGEQVDERSLVFSVGVLLFEKLTGRHPFGEKSNPRRVARIQKGEIGSGVNYFPAVPAGLRMVLMKAMGPFPEERWESLGELRAQLDYFVAAATAPPQGRLPRASTPPPLKRRPLPPPPSTSTSTSSSSSTRRRDLADEDEEATRIRERPITGSVPAIQTLSRVESQPGATAHSAGFTLPSWQPPPRASLVRRLAPLGYVGLGVLLTVIGLKLAGGGGGGAPARTPLATAPASAPTSASAAKAAPAASAPVAIAPAPAAVPVPSAAAAGAPVAKATPAAAGASSAPPPTEPAAEGTFAPHAAGDRALALARDCFSAEKLAGGARFGVGILYAKPDGLAKKLYFASANEIALPERQCLNAAWIGKLSAGTPPRNVVVEYRFRVRTEGSDFKMQPIPDPE